MDFYIRNLQRRAQCGDVDAQKLLKVALNRIGDYKYYYIEAETEYNDIDHPILDMKHPITKDWGRAWRYICHSSQLRADYARSAHRKIRRAVKLLLRHEDYPRINKPPQTSWEVW